MARSRGSHSETPISLCLYLCPTLYFYRALSPPLSSAKPPLPRAPPLASRALAPSRAQNIAHPKRGRGVAARPTTYRHSRAESKWRVGVTRVSEVCIARGKESPPDEMILRGARGKRHYRCRQKIGVCRRAPSIRRRGATRPRHHCRRSRLPECSALCTTDVPAAPAAAEDNLATVDRWRFTSAMKGGGSCGRGSLMWAAVGCTTISLLSAASSMRSGATLSA